MDEPLSVWLALREAADAAARSPRVTGALIEALAPFDLVRAVDLASGTGANIRFLLDRLPPMQRWLAVDRDPELLALAPVRTHTWATARDAVLTARPTEWQVRSARLDATVETRVADLGTLDDSSLFADRHLVTASALLDLVSEPWLRRLAAQCAAADAVALFTLSYDGRSSCEPMEPEDELVRSLMNRHQHTDKGLGGPAAGPDAATRVAGVFREAGFEVVDDRSDWQLDAAQAAMQRALITGWARAACDIAPEHSGAVADWFARRLRHLDAGLSRIVVGHRDMVAWRPRG